MRAPTALSAAALLAAFAACGDATAPQPAAPLDAGRYDATFMGGFSGAAEGTAFSYALGKTTTGPQIWIELRDEREPAQNTLVRFIVRASELGPGTHAVGGAVGANPVDAVALLYHAGSSTADVRYLNFTGSMEVEESTPAGMRGNFDVRSAAGGSGTLHARGRFNAVPADF
jgi:hypothetical protein